MASRSIKLTLFVALLGALFLFGCTTGASKKSTLSVAVIGHSSAELRAALADKVFASNGIGYIGGDIVPYAVKEEELKNFDVLIVTGNADCDLSERRVLTARAKAGAPIVFVGDACTKTSQDPSACGIGLGKGLLGDVSAVEACNSDAGRPAVVRTSLTGASLQPTASGGYVFKPSISSQASLTGDFVSVSTQPGAVVLATANDGNSAIVKSSAGNVFYFAFDPGLARNELFNLLNATR